LERGWGFHYEQSRRITYERIDLITPDKYDLLLADLRQRTGLPIKRAEVGHIDFLKDATEIKVFYDSATQWGWNHTGRTALVDADELDE